MTIRPTVSDTQNALLMPIGTDLDFAKEMLSQGELVAIPTETVYGLAAHAFDEQAVAKVFEVKARPAFDPLILHTHSLEAARGFVAEMPKAAERLANLVWPGPLTLVLPKAACIPDLVTSGLDEVAIRVPSHPMAMALLTSLDFPLVAPSANPFGYISPTRAEHVDKQLGDQIAYILDGGPTRLGLESTVVAFPDGQPTILRLGALEPTLIKMTLGEVKINTHSSSDPKAPGMLKKHYAPKARLLLGQLDTLIPMFAGQKQKVAVLSFKDRRDDVPPDDLFLLSNSGNLQEAAKHLFAWLREIDDAGYEVILAERVPDEGLGKAINDRLKRAAAK